MSVFPIQVVISIITLSVTVWFFVRSQRAITAAKRDHELGTFSRGVKRSIATLDGHPEEVVHLVGVLRGKTIHAPLSKRECIAWDVRIFAHWGKGASELHALSEVVDGTITDDSGNVHFDGEGAKAILAGNSFRADELPKKFRKAAEAILPAESPRPVGYHAIETILVNGDRVALTARVPAASGDGYRESQALRLVSRPDAELVVTDDAELIGS
jgi:hypothetical protein